jgi:PKD repeat protein
MFKKVLFAGIGLLFVASPLFASAQTADGTASVTQQLIAYYSQLIQLLEQEISQLTAAIQNSGTSNASNTFSATPTSGVAPLTVVFTTGSMASNPYSISFGDGSSPQALTSANCTSSSLASPATCTYQATYTYASAGTYTATATDPSGNAVGTETITVSPALSTSAPACFVSFSPSTVSTGESFTETWTSVDATALQAVLLENGVATAPTTTVALSGSSSFSLLVPDNYLALMQATGPGGSSYCSAPVTVAAESASTSSTSATSTGASCTTAKFTFYAGGWVGTLNYEYMNYPGTGGASGSLSYLGSPTTATYSAGTVLQGNPDWFDGTPDAPPRVGCGGGTFAACFPYQCENGTWTTSANTQTAPTINRATGGGY